MRKNTKLLVTILIAISAAITPSVFKLKLDSSKVSNENPAEMMLQGTVEDVSGDIIILYTNDVHCGIEENIGYAGLAKYKESLEKHTPYVTLVDCGDAIQGDFIGLTSNGLYIADIMNELDYQLAILGNHEFDYGMESLKELIKHSEAEYLGCNINYTGDGENALSDVKPYTIMKYGDISVGYIGVSTPESISSSTPAHFMENGEYVYDFTGGNNGKDLYDRVQYYVDACQNEGADYIIALTHLGDTEDFTPYSAADLAHETLGIDVILDGHAHNEVPCKIEQNLSGENVLLSSTGTKLVNIGQLVITEDGHISTGLISGYSKKDDVVEAFIDGIQENYESDLQKVVASSDVLLSGYTEDGVRLVRNRETTIGNFCADAYRYVAKADIALVNGGGIRADLPIGNITYSDLFAVHPYGNTLCMVETTGQEILDCLEMCYRFVLPKVSENGVAIGEDGGFQQVSGLRFTVDTSVDSSVVVDEYDRFLFVEGERRVKDVCVLDENHEYVPLKKDAVYKLASHNYMLKDGGSGCGMFADNSFLIDEGMVDYQVLVSYMEDAMDGRIDDRYAKTDDRITIK